MIMALSYCPGNLRKNWQQPRRISGQLASGLRFDLCPPWHTAEWQPLEYCAWSYISCVYCTAYSKILLHLL